VVGVEEMERGGERANGWIMNASCVHACQTCAWTNGFSSGDLCSMGGYEFDYIG
jgi:hypothetical protein